MKCGKLDSTNHKQYPDLGSDASSVINFALVSQTSFGGETSGSITKCRLFSRANKGPVSFHILGGCVWEVQL